MKESTIKARVTPTNSSVKSTSTGTHAVFISKKKNVEQDDCWSHGADEQTMTMASGLASPWVWCIDFARLRDLISCIHNEAVCRQGSWAQALLVVAAVNIVVAVANAAVLAVGSVQGRLSHF